MRAFLSSICVVALVATSLGAQSPAVASNTATQQAPGSTPEKEKSYKPSAFYEAQEPIEVTFTTNIGKIRGDKGTEPPWRPATMSYKDTAGSTISVPLKARTRGIWRLRMCDFPPLRLNFSGENAKGTIFHHLDKPKLVSYCQDRDGYERYILEEYQLYRIYQLLTPVSHRARLLRFSYTDSGSGKVRARRFGFIIEEPNAQAGAAKEAQSTSRPPEVKKEK